MNKFYTGVGSRDAPDEILEFIESVAQTLAAKGWTLRSGGANGCDYAFQDGAWRESEITPEIYLPWYGYNDSYIQSGLLYPRHFKNFDEALELASAVHPNWGACSEGAKLLHSRNAYQVLGGDLNSPSKFLICWARGGKDGVPVGGTRTAWVLAQNYGIPCFNLINEGHFKRISKMLEGV